jgi:hypothetical protein
MAIAPFQISVTNTDANRMTIAISGPINETARFPDLKSDSQITVDLTKVTGLNSVGIRAWCLWVQRVRPPAEMVLVGCPVIVVKNFKSITGFLNDQCRVFSFVVPYYSSRTGERGQVLATWGKHFDSRGMIGLPRLNDSEGQPMELDVVEETYFKFLNK